MRTIFKTNYNQDIALTRDWVDRFWYGLLLLVLVVLPFLIDSFWLGELSYVLILFIVGAGLMLLTGFAGQVSIGHGAFVGIGAYTHAVLLGFGLPLFASIPLSTLATAAVGAMVGYPALRLAGIYLAMATLSFTFIVEHVFVHWGDVTGGYDGMVVPSVDVAGLQLTSGAPFYYMTLVAALFALLVALNILRSPTGRAFVAIRDSEVAAQSMGINIAAKKTLAFTISAGFAGLAGTLFAHYIGYLAPDSFGFLLSIQFLLMVVVGGLGSLHGAAFGAVFVGALPQLIALARDYLPSVVAQQPGLEPGLFGLILVLFILFEPRGISGRWMKVKSYFSLFPTYRKATFRRQKSYAKSERFR